MLPGFLLRPVATLSMPCLFCPSFNNCWASWLKRRRCVAHAYHGLVEVNVRVLFQSAVFELVHHVVVHSLAVNGAAALLGVERRDAAGKAFLYEVVAQMSVIVGTYCRRHVERAFPVGLRNHFQHHHFALVDGAFAFERDVHHIGEWNQRQSSCRSVSRLPCPLSLRYCRSGRFASPVVVQDPVPDDVLQLVRVVAQHLFQVFRTVFVIVDDLLEGIGLHGDAFARTGDVLQTGPTDGQRRRVVGRTAHLVNVPVGLQVTQVADTGIGTHAFRFLVVPQRGRCRCHRW